MKNDFVKSHFITIFANEFRIIKFVMEQKKYKIKDGEIIITTTIKIDDYSRLLRYNNNLSCLANDIRHSRSDEKFRNFLLKAKELFAEEVSKAKPRKNSPLGNHSIFYYMYGHMNDWVRYAEKELIQLKAMLTQAYHIEETVQIIRNSRDQKDAAKQLMDVLGLDEIGAKHVAGEKLSHLVGIRPDHEKMYVDELEKRLSNIKELAKYDR